MAHHNETGTLGEQMAVDYLAGLGFTLYHRNWRSGRFEVDIIAEKKGILHFIEVKTRRSLKYGHPEENVDRKKIIHLINAAEAYLHIHPQWKRIRFDILAISMLKDKEVEYFFIEDVYL